VKDKPWYTVAETSELALALHAVGLVGRAKQLLAWTRRHRTDNGAYWTGATHPANEIFPEDEQTTWTAAAVLIGHDAVLERSATSDFFTSLAGSDLDGTRPRHELPARTVAGERELQSAAE
jgi:hypothetical protein